MAGLLPPVGYSAIIDRVGVLCFDKVIIFCYTLSITSPLNSGK